MYLGLEEDKDIGSCQPKILSFEKKNHFEYAGASGGYLDFYIILLQRKNI